MHSPQTTGARRLRFEIQGTVQGIGFRPFVWRQAQRWGLGGWVCNDGRGAVIEVEGTQANLDGFEQTLRSQPPPHARYTHVTCAPLPPQGQTDFCIAASRRGESLTAIITPDLATCPQCLAELFDPANRRYRYPFINCTHCGPRLSIIERLPYDRPNTSMKHFTMCPACQREYDDPGDRRFHAQPNACPACGPQLELLGPQGQSLGRRDEALGMTVHALKDGQIVAVQGLGGFHLMVRADVQEAVARLRERKRRELKPLALMVPSVEIAGHLCRLDAIATDLLTSPAAPIVLLERRGDEEAAGLVCDAVAPGNPSLGLMLPYTPLHHLLLHELQIPVVATSGNLSDEPICTSPHEALERLNTIADLFLVHDRPIVRPVDDSVVRPAAGSSLTLRRARGLAPGPVSMPSPVTALAVGGHLKNTIGVLTGGYAMVSQHIGDLDTLPATQAFERTVADFSNVYALTPEHIVHDAHPDYASSLWSQRQPSPRLSVQHHAAHVMACMAEHHLEPPVLGVAWDGTGWGPDGTVWGGEWLAIKDDRVQRVVHLLPLTLPGGEAAVREPRRCAWSAVVMAMGLDWVGANPWVRETLGLTLTQSNNLTKLMQQKDLSPPASSAGRLFDAAASLMSLCYTNRYEGQAAMTLEWNISRAGARCGQVYSFALNPPQENAQTFCIDWRPMIAEILFDLKRKIPVGIMAEKFHNAMIEIIVAVAKACKIPTVALGGGCFQNKYLLEGVLARLNAEAFQAYWPQQYPAGDGAIALGQLWAASHQSIQELL